MISISPSNNCSYNNFDDKTKFNRYGFTINKTLYSTNIRDHILKVEICIPNVIYNFTIEFFWLKKNHSFRIVL